MEAPKRSNYKKRAVQVSPSTSSQNKNKIWCRISRLKIFLSKTSPENQKLTGHMSHFINEVIIENAFSCEIFGFPEEDLKPRLDDASNDMLFDETGQLMWNLYLAEFISQTSIDISTVKMWMLEAGSWQLLTVLDNETHKYSYEIATTFHSSNTRFC